MLRDESVGIEAMWCGVEPAMAEREAVARDAGHAQQCERVHRRLRRIVKARGALDAQEAAALREAERLRVWRHYGYSSLLEYMEMEMGYSPRVALERLRVAKAIVELPAIAEAMAQGDLSFSAGRELTRVATAETEGQWLDAANDRNLRQIEDLVSGHQPGDKPTDPVEPKLRKRKLRYDQIDPETDALMRQARQVVERELGERIDDNAFLRMMARLVVDGARSEPRSHAPYQIAVTVCEQCMRATQDGGGITVEMSPSAVEMALCDAQHIGRVDVEAARVDIEAARVDTEATRVAPKVERAKSGIPPALRRKVNARDHGRCRVPWCRSSRNIDQHHMVPVSQGGQHTLDNLITLCESHHLAHHEGALAISGTASTAAFTPRAHSTRAGAGSSLSGASSCFAIAERIVETGLALKALGFDKHEVRIAVEKARTHVGTSELGLEQWIKIALSYCPKPGAA